MERFPSRRTYLIILFLLAFVLRFGMLLALRDIHRFHGAHTAGADAVEFNAIALNLAAGRGYAITPGLPTSFRAPGFPLFLAALYRISYQNYELGYLALVMLGALTSLVTYAAAREILTENWARIAGLLAAVYPPHIYFSTIFLSEALFAFCVGLGLWLVLVFLRKRSMWLLPVAGLCLGYAALTRPIGLLIPIFLAPALIRRASPDWRRAAGWMLLFALGTAAIVLPWTLRNRAVHHHWVLMTTNGGSTFYGANNDITLHGRHFLGSWIATNYLPGRKAIDATPDEYSHDRLEWKLGEDWVAAHPFDLPLLVCYKISRFWLPDWSSPNSKAVLMQMVGYTPIGILILLGLAASWRRTMPAWLAVHGVLAATLFSTVIFYGSARFRDAIAPALMIYAAYGLERAVGMARGKKK